MAQICSFVVRQGVLEARRRDTWVSVNISPLSLQSSTFFGLLSEIGWVSDRARIYLEITERKPFDSAYLEKLQLFGYGVLLDDFGQGHSSLIQLLQMLGHLHTGFFKIKIDGWFSQHLGDRSTQLVMAEFINILHGLGLEAIAECIETETQLKIWQDLGCDYGQGWYWR
jgi:EAL domain-containing protein (putative c-di-GMP-specific phosphodiesterase class I)